MIFEFTVNFVYTPTHNPFLSDCSNKHNDRLDFEKYTACKDLMGGT